jgi:hypothetical protein
MSAIQFIVKSIQDMSQADREAVFAAFAMDPPVASPKPAAKPKAEKAPKAAKEPKAEKAPKKERANAGIPTAWAVFSNQKRLENKVVIEAWAAERVALAKAGELFYASTDAAVKAGRAKAGDPIPENKAKVGAHLTWVSMTYKGEDQSEWKAFEAAWKEAHPKGTAATAENSDDTATVTDDDTGAPSAAVGGAGSAAAAAKPADAPKKRGPKKMADMTPEEQAAAKAKRAANKAKKASANNSAEGSRASSPPKVKGD